jgi:hypothetical protein
MRSGIELENIEGDAVQVYPIDHTSIRGRRFEDLVLVTPDSSWIGDGNHVKNIDVLDQFGDSLAINDRVISEVTDWTPHRDSDKKRRGEILDFLDKSETVNLEQVIKDDKEANGKLNSLYNLQGALAKRIAYDFFSQHFEQIYQNCIALVGELRSGKLRNSSRPLRRNERDYLVDRIVRLGEAKKERLDRKKGIEKEIVSLIYSNSQGVLIQKVEEAVAYANSLNGHHTTVPIDTKFWRYWKSTYTEHIKIMLCRTMHDAVIGIGYEQARLNLEHRFDKDAITDIQVSMMPLMLNRGSGKAIVFQKDCDFYQILALAYLTKKKPKSDTVSPRPSDDINERFIY